MHQGHQLGQQYGSQYVVATGNADRTGGFVPQRRERIQFRLDLVEPVADGLEQPLTGRGGRHAARGAGQQPDLQPLFQRLDGLAECRLGHPQHGARAGKAPFTGHRDEGQQIVEVASCHRASLAYLIN
ncbi:hypothetical protein D9M68_796670 [compost metagenome]